MVSTLFGIENVALPAGIITAGYMTEIQRREEEKSREIMEPERTDSI